MVEARFGGRPPSVLIIGALPFTASASQAFEGVIPPWLVLAGAEHLTNPAKLQLTPQMPAATFSISGTVEAKSAPPASNGTYTLRLRVRGPFKPNIEKQFPFPWPAGQASITVAGSVAVSSGYNDWSWAQFNAVATNYRDFSWTVIG